MNSLLKLTILVFLVVFSACEKNERTFTESDISIIPKPVSLTITKGVFEFDDKTVLVAKDEELKEVYSNLINKFSQVADWKLEISPVEPSKNYIRLKSDKALIDEGYELDINELGITVRAAGKAGFLYGLETISQLLPTAIESKQKVNNVSWIVPCLIIKDQPRFEWRGLMLDISRHFFDKTYIKKVIDGLAMHKMNVLHLHLMDDQGWRIEIKKYPKLTEIGAWRDDQEHLPWNGRTAVDPGVKGTYGGFLSQEDLKEIVAYAALNNVEVVPEIEMPAHISSAIASYPHLSCVEKPIGVPPGGIWPITDIYCAGKESTFEFLEDVLLEVMDIFPSSYIHIGGDEATKVNWAKCPNCKKRMEDEGIHDVEELQSYFVKRIETFINSHNKKLIGWDEILEGGLAPDATVMSWRGFKGGLEAAKQGHDVIMTPGSHCYFDHYQGPQNEEPMAFDGFLPLSKVYQFDPVVDSMAEEEAKHVLGGQANLWSEHITTDSHSEYMIYPRLAALSESVWSPKESKDWVDFSTRMIPMFERYDKIGINYAKSAYLVTSDTKVDLSNKTVSLILKNEFPKSDIRFVLNGNKNDNLVDRYKEPIKLNGTTSIRASLFQNNKRVGKEFNDTINFHMAVGKSMAYKEKYSDKYQGAGEFNLVNTLRGTKNFHDGQWQAWLNKDMEIIIDLGDMEMIGNVKVGSMENQGSGIFFPVGIDILISEDGEKYEKVGSLQRAYKANIAAELLDFKITFDEKNTRFVKVIARNLKKSPKGGGVWLFIDEVMVD